MQYNQQINYFNQTAATAKPTSVFIL